MVGDEKLTAPARTKAGWTSELVCEKHALANEDIRDADVGRLALRLSSSNVRDTITERSTRSGRNERKNVLRPHPASNAERVLRSFIKHTHLATRGVQRAPGRLHQSSLSSGPSGCMPSSMPTPPFILSHSSTENVTVRSGS